MTDGLEIKQALVTLTEESNQMGPKRRWYKERRKKKREKEKEGKKKAISEK